MSDPYRDPPPGPSRAPAQMGPTCPRCGVGLGGVELAGVWFDACARCDGQFVRREALAELEDEPHRVDELVAMLGRTRSPIADGGPMYVKCPRCRTVMNRAQYAAGAKVVVDYCRVDGVWFDGGELAKALEFVVAGGLVRARAAAERPAAPRPVGVIELPERRPRSLLAWLAELLA